MGVRFFGVVLGVLLSACSTARSNRPVESFADDALRAELSTRPDGEVAQVHRLWLGFLKSRAPSFGCVESQHWVAEERAIHEEIQGFPVCRAHFFAGEAIGFEDVPDVLEIAPVTGVDGREYRITSSSRYVSMSSTGRSPRRALVTVYAVKRDNQWKLSDALARNTRDWRRETVGPFRYVISPGYQFSRTRAEEAVAFADSLASAFGLPAMTPVDYYLVSNADEMQRIKGIETDTVYGLPGGQALPGLIISGDSVFREKHGHEIAHTVLRPLYIQPNGIHLIASEGVPSWLGGTRSWHFREAVGALRGYLIANPSATMDTVFAFHPMHNAGAALLSAMIYDHAGVDGIRQLMNTGWTTSAFRAGVEKILGKRWDEIASEWKQRAVSSQ